MAHELFRVCACLLGINWALTGMAQDGPKQSINEQPFQFIHGCYVSGPFSLSMSGKSYFDGRLLGTWITEGRDEIVSVHVDKLGSLVVDVYRSQDLKKYNRVCRRIATRTTVIGDEFIMEWDFGISGGNQNFQENYVACAYRIRGEDSLEFRRLSRNYVMAEKCPGHPANQACRFENATAYREFVETRLTSDSLWTRTYSYQRFVGEFDHQEMPDDLSYVNRYSNEDSKTWIGLGILMFATAGILSSNNQPVAPTSTGGGTSIGVLGYDKDRNAIYSYDRSSEIRYDLNMNPR